MRLRRRHLRPISSSASSGSSRRRTPGCCADCEAALRAYDAASGGEAEERYGDFVDLVDTAQDELEELRDAYVASLDAGAAEEYAELFNELARKRFPRFAMELD